MLNLPSGKELGHYFESTKVVLVFMSLDKIQIYFLDSKLLRSAGVLCTNVYVQIPAEKKRIKTQAEEFAFFNANGDNFSCSAHVPHAGSTLGLADTCLLPAPASQEAWCSW